MSTLTRSDVTVATPRPTDVRDAVRAFLAADTVAEEARGGLTREQAAGYAELPPDVEFLFCEADDRYESLLRLVGLDEVVARLTGGVSADYADRRPPHVVNKTEPLAGDWRESVGRVDWTRGAA
jgi:hypothetical protein